MADITKCHGIGCTVTELCFRYTAKSNPLWQAWFVEVPGKDRTCPHFWPAVDTSVVGRPVLKGRQASRGRVQ